MPAEKGDVRNLTNTPGVAERDPAWSPDGKRIAYFSDESGEYALHMREQNGMGEVQEDRASAIRPAFYYRPALVARQQEDRLHRQASCKLWYIDLEKKTPRAHRRRHLLDAVRTT